MLMDLGPQTSSLNPRAVGAHRVEVRFAPVPLVKGKLGAVREAGQYQHLKPPIFSTTSPKNFQQGPCKRESQHTSRPLFRGGGR
jgi:hypothetical protein